MDTLSVQKNITLLKLWIQEQIEIVCAKGIPIRGNQN